MNFTVEWQREAEEQLAELWLNAPDRNAVTAAARELDLLLERDPLNTGESRAGLERLLFHPPLAILFVVNEPDRLVRVASVGWSRRAV